MASVFGNDDSNLQYPLHRLDRISIQHLGEGIAQETLLYDEDRHQAFCLNPVAAAVWQSCDGTRTPGQIALSVSASLNAPVSLESVQSALDQLRSDNLMTVEAASHLQPLPAQIAALSRRRLLVRAGTGAALMIPAVAMILAPKAAQAYGGCFDCSNASTAAIRARSAAAAQAQPKDDTPLSTSLGKF